MAMKQHGASSVVVLAVLVVTVFLTLPYVFNSRGPETHAGSVLVDVDGIHGGHLEPVVPAGEPASPPRAPTLEEVLSAAAMASQNGEKTVILTALNEAWAANNSMLDVFLEGFATGDGTQQLLQHLVIVCVDAVAFERCAQMHPHCFRLETEGGEFAGGEKTFMSNEFLKMMWRRIQLLGEVLQLGYSFIFSDGDIVWFRNPLAVFSKTMDFQISTDRYRHKPYDLQSNFPNSGFLYSRSNNRTIALYRHWYEQGQLSPGKNDQNVLTTLFQHRQDLIGELGLKVKFFDTVYFSGFCQVSRDMSKVVTMHSNCCIGLSSKLNDLRLAMADWRSYRDAAAAAAPPLNEGNKTLSRSRRGLWRVPSKCDYL